MSNVPPVLAFRASAAGRGRGRGRGHRQGRGGVQRGRGQRRVTCPTCGKGFKFSLIPPLHVCCKECNKTWHTRCVRNGTGGGTEFICQDCSAQTPVAVSPPPVVTAPPAPERPAPVTSVQTPVVTTPVPPAPERPPPASRLTDAAPVNPVPREMLLSEPSDCLPTYRDNMEKFDALMYEHGFKRSPTQLDTPANGDCGPEAFIDQLNWNGVHGIHTRDPPGQNGVAALLLR